MVLSKRKQKRLEIRITCYQEDLDLVMKRFELSGFKSLSRYMLECALNVRGVQDWEERAIRAELIGTGIVFHNLLINKLTHELGTTDTLRNTDWVSLKEDMQSLKETLEQIVNLHETNLLSQEQKEHLIHKDLQCWNYYEQPTSSKEGDK